MTNKMNNKFCTGCGARLAPNVKLCPQCGKLVDAPRPQQTNPPKRRPAPQSRSDAGAVRSQSRNLSGRVNAKPARRPLPPKTAKKPAAAPARPAPYIYEGHPDAAPSDKKRKSTALIFRILTVLVILAAAYAAIFAVQVFRVKISSYDFDTDMKLSHKNYGQAIEDYFEDGKWSVNPFSGVCVYKGETKHGEEYEIVFTARISVKVDKITVNGKTVDDKQIENRLMGMFI